jgi:hypothetical protein
MHNKVDTSYGIMNRTTIVLPEKVKAQAMKQARARGISFGELMREALGRELRGAGGEDAARRRRRGAIEAMLRFGQHARPGPRDLSARLDDYLYGSKKAKGRA